MESIICIIPARFGSTRLKGKPLAEICGIPLIVHVYRNAHMSGVFDEVCVATDDERIAEAVIKAGGKAEMTSSQHLTGTDRVFEAAARYNFQYVVNLQGDEPEIPAELLKKFTDYLKNLDDNTLLTVVSHATIEEKNNINVVKAVLKKGGRALYFSRAPIPYQWEGDVVCYKHAGIYGFTFNGLKKYCSLPKGKLETAERLEQLRALENGMEIVCITYDFISKGIDTEEDLERYRKEKEKNKYGIR